MKYTVNNIKENITCLQTEDEKELINYSRAVRDENKDGYIIKTLFDAFQYLKNCEDLDLKISYDYKRKRSKESIRELLQASLKDEYTLLAINNVLEQIFGKDYKIEEATREDDELSDYTYLVEMTNPEYYGFIDIYYLKTRYEDVIYITGINVEFED